MAGKGENRIFVGGFPWDFTERQLELAFARYGKILQCNIRRITLDRDTGRPHGFGFITFSDRRGMEDAIKEMHGLKIADHIISVNKARPKMGGDGVDQGYKGSYSSSGRGSYGVGDRIGQDDCFKCRLPGHWARHCPFAGGGRGRGHGSFSTYPRFGCAGGHGDRLGRERDGYVDECCDGGRYYGDKDRFDNRHYKHGDQRTESMSASIEAAKAKAGRYKAQANQVTSSTIDPYSIDACMELLDSMEYIPSKMYNNALVKFKDKDWRLMFTKMPSFRRKDWLASLE